MLSADLRAATDEELTSLVAAAASEEACAELFRRYKRKVYLWCFNYVHEVEEAVDFSQEIFIKIFKGIGGFEGRSSFSTWVYRITRNHCLRELSRNRSRLRKRQVEIDGETLAEPMPKAFWHQVDNAADLETLLSRARSRMKEGELEAFVLHYRDGLSVKEITRILACENVTGARTLIQNARRKFKRMVEGKDGWRD